MSALVGNLEDRFSHNEALIQVAHFYNTIDQQMIPSQKPMMLESAKAFERLAKNPKTGKTKLTAEKEIVQPTL